MLDDIPKSQRHALRCYQKLIITGVETCNVGTMLRSSNEHIRSFDTIFGCKARFKMAAPITYLSFHEF